MLIADSGRPSSNAQQSAPRRRVAVLICGEPPQAVLDTQGTYGDQFAALLQQASASNEDWRFWDAYQGDLPSEEELAGYDAIVFTGGGGDAFSDDPWVVKARQLVKAAHLRKQRMLGVCFGHQLIAQALGGRVGRAAGWGVGAKVIRFAPEAAAALPLLAGELPPTATINAVHQDQVQELPQGATPLASTEECPIAMYSIGDHVLCIQGHPEFNRDTVEAIVEAQVGKQKMGNREKEEIAGSYARLDPARDFQLIQRICTSHLRK